MRESVVPRGIPAPAESQSRPLVPATRSRYDVVVVARRLPADYAGAGGDGWRGHELLVVEVHWLLSHLATHQLLYMP